MDEGIQQLIEWIENLAPEVWRMAMTRIYVGAVIDFI